MTIENDALEYIRKNLGHVCGNYEFCDHKSCSDSHAAWEIADATLRGRVHPSISGMEEV